MKKIIYFLVALAAAAFITSCGAIEKASERDVEVGDFDFTVVTNDPYYVPPIVGAIPAQNVTLTRGLLPLNGYSGSYTITRADLLDGADSFNYNMVKAVQVGEVIVQIVQSGLGSYTANVTLSCPGLASVNLTNFPLSDANQVVPQLKAFAGAVAEKAIGEGEATVSITASTTASESAIGFAIFLSNIVVRAGLDL